MILPVILAGGIGSRLWPLSRDLYPKQLLSLIGEQSLLQATVARALQIPDVSHVLVVCNVQYQFLVQEQLDALKARYPVTFDLILEPVGRNTAPALTLAAWRAVALKKQMLLALPADHLIGDAQLFAQQLQNIIPHIDHQLLTFGIKPDYPETGYGYIEVDDSASETNMFSIKAFVEKPDKPTAAKYCEQTNFYWNSGIFLYRPDSYLAEIKAHAADVFTACEHAWSKKTQVAESIYLDHAAYAACPDISIDYAIMEKTRFALMAPLQTTWDDVGSWLAVSKIETSDTQGNHCLGDVIALDTTDCYLRAESRLLATVGLHNQIVVETADAILVADKSCAQKVKHLVEQLKNKKRKEAESHAILYHPWGHYEIVCEGIGFVVKQVTIKSTGSLAAVSAENTCEHWIVLAGAARIFVDGMSSLLVKNQFIDILPLTHYRIDNETAEPLKMLSIQTI
jgi:mannose-1-phosphate guanylyltransferase/mannose-6-phosphate isomerase